MPTRSRSTTSLVALGALAALGIWWVLRSRSDDPTGAPAEPLAAAPPTSAPPPSPAQRDPRIANHAPAGGLPPPRALPTALPDTPAVAAWLREQGMPDGHEMQDYLLGLNAHVERCMRGAVEHGEIRFWIHWTVDDSHVGHGSYEPDPSAPPSGFDDADREQLERCASDYIAAHDATLPSFGGPGKTDLHWATAIAFPIAEQEVYRVIAGEPLPAE